MYTAFLDRDGVINRKAPDGEYITRYLDFEFLPGSITGLRMLKRAGWRLVVVTNQRGVALGRMSAAQLGDIHNKMRHDLESVGAGVDAIYACVHDKGTCRCRKPETGLFHQARRDWSDVDFAESVMIGDSFSDMQAAARLGCQQMWIGHMADSLEEAAHMLLDADSMSPYGLPNSTNRAFESSPRPHYL